MNPNINAFMEVVLLWLDSFEIESKILNKILGRLIIN